MQVSIGIICDIALLIVLVLVALSGRQKGFLAGLMSLVGAVASIIGAVWAARVWAVEIYQKYLGTAIGDKVSAAVAEQGENAPALLEKYLGFLPDTVQEKMAQALQTAAESGSTDIAGQVVTALEPLLLPILQMLLFLAVCLVLRALFGFLVKLLRAFNALPVLGSLNKILGFAFGFVTGAIDCWLICMVLWAALTLTAGRVDWFTADAMSHSILYTFFSHLNPLLVHY